MYYLALEDKPAGPFDLDQVRRNWRSGALTPDTLYWMDGMAEWEALETIRDLLDDDGSFAAAPAPMLLAGFWRRLGAFAADVLILCAGGFIVGIFLFSFFTALGVCGPLFGLVVATGYFGTLNSRIGGGQTVGKRLFGVRVVDPTGGLISPERAVGRTLLLWGPYALYGMVTLGFARNGPPLQPVIIAWAGAMVYLYLFNRETRQTVHDLGADTYVVSAASRQPALTPSIARGQRLVAASFAALIVLAQALAMIMQPVSHAADIARVKESVFATKNVRTVDLAESTETKGPAQIEVCSLEVRLAARPKSMQGAEARIAAAALKSPWLVKNKQRLSITVFYGYDIGIGSGTVSDTAEQRVSEWLKNPVPPAP